VRSLQWRHLPDLGAQYVPRNKLSNYRPRNLCLRQRPPTAGSLTYQNFVLTRNLAAGFDTVCPRRSLMTQVQHWAKAAQTDHVTLRPSKFGHARPLGSRIIRYVRVGRTDGQKTTLIPPSLRWRHRNLINSQCCTETANTEIPPV